MNEMVITHEGVSFVFTAANNYWEYRLENAAIDNVAKVVDRGPLANRGYQYEVHYITPTGTESNVPVYRSLERAVKSAVNWLLVMEKMGK